MSKENKKAEKGLMVNMLTEKKKGFTNYFVVIPLGSGEYLKAEVMFKWLSPKQKRLVSYVVNKENNDQ